MNADQLWETTMDPDTRTLIRVTIDDLARQSDAFQSSWETRLPHAVNGLRTMSPLPWRKIRFFKAFFLRKVLTYLISNCYSCAQYSFIKDCNHRGNSDEARHLPTKLQSSVGRHLLFCIDRLSQYQGLGTGKASSLLCL